MVVAAKVASMVNTYLLSKVNSPPLLQLDIPHSVAKKIIASSSRDFKRSLFKAANEVLLTVLEPHAKCFLESKEKGRSATSFSRMSHYSHLNDLQFLSLCRKLL